MGAEDRAGFDELVADLAAQHAELDGLVEGLTDADWHRPSPCVGWDVADVLVHLQQTDALAIATLRDELTDAIETFMRGDGAVDAAAEQSVSAARGRAPADVLAGWRSSTAELRERLAVEEPGRRVQWVVGTLTARTLAATRLSECWIHTTDVAAALGREVAPTARLRHIARLAWRTVPYAYELAGQTPRGAVGLDLDGVDGAPWRFGMDVDPPTVVRGPAVDFCLVAGQRATPDSTALVVTGPDADRLLDLVRTYA